jgi:[ribosomal protein S5]-alanine N-acetyltransferase
LKTEELSIAAMIEQVELRPVRLQDAEQLARLYTEQRDFLAPFDPIRADAFYTAAGQRADIEQAIAHAASGLRFRYVIVADGMLVGALGLSNVVRAPHFRSANLGYFVAREANGRGVATRAIGLALGEAFGPLGLHRVEAGTLTDNIGSQRVLEKNGFERIGIARDYLQIAGKWRDHVLFQRLAE